MRGLFCVVQFEESFYLNSEMPAQTSRRTRKKSCSLLRRIKNRTLKEGKHKRDACARKEKTYKTTSREFFSLIILR